MSKITYTELAKARRTYVEKVSQYEEGFASDSEAMLRIAFDKTRHLESALFDLNGMLESLDCEGMDQWKDLISETMERVEELREQELSHLEDTQPPE